MIKKINEEELPRIKKFIGAIKERAPEYEVRGVFRIVDQTPAGPKANYLERKIEEVPLELLFGGVIFLCRKNSDPTNGEYRIEVSTRDVSVRVHERTPSGEAKKIEEIIRNLGYPCELYL